MTKQLKDEIERLLAEGPAASQGRLRARLAADLSEGLAASGGGTDAFSDDQAAQAAFLDRKLGPEREEFIAALARDPSLRAELESAAALLDSVRDAPASVPAHLMAQARAQFAPDPAPRPPVATPRWDWSSLWPRSRRAWAMAAAVLAVVIITPGALLIVGDELGWTPWHQTEPTSASPQPDTDTPEACDEQGKQNPEASGPTTEQPAAAAKRKDAQAAPGTPTEDPCKRDQPSKDGSIDTPRPPAR